MRSIRKPGWLRQFLVRLFAVALALNWFWEMLQMPGFEQMMGRPWRTTVLTCTVAALGDAAITLGIYALVALITKRWRWPSEGRWKTYLAASLSGAAVAIVIEKASLAVDFWSYSSRMPVVPVFGAGFWPLLQLTLLVPLAMRLSSGWISRRQIRE
ncbi:MAG TPA: hypothetical protein VJ464_10935 [Blastocatellia bacterium]|nr:hypothetical protein [Blastocatellia bacterium]